MSDERKSGIAKAPSGQAAAPKPWTEPAGRTGTVVQRKTDNGDSKKKTGVPAYRWDPTLGSTIPPKGLPSVSTYLVTATPGSATFTSLDQAARMLQNLALGSEVGTFAEVAFSAKVPIPVPGLVVEVEVSGKYTHLGEHKLELDAVAGINWRFLSLMVFRHIELTGGNLGLAFKDSALQMVRQELIDIGLEQELRDLAAWNEASLAGRSAEVLGDFLHYGAVSGSAVLFGKVLSTQMTRRQLTDLWKSYETAFANIPDVGFEISKGAGLKLEANAWGGKGSLSGEFAYGLEDVGEKKERTVKFLELSWGGKLKISDAEMTFESSKRWRSDGSTEVELELHGEFPVTEKLAPVVVAMHTFIKASALWKALGSAKAAKKDKSSVFDAAALAEGAAIFATVPVPFAERKLGFDISFTNTAEAEKESWKVKGALRLYQESSHDLSVDAAATKAGLKTEMKTGAIIDLSAEMQKEVDKRAADLQKQRKSFQDFKFPPPLMTLQQAYDNYKQSVPPPYQALSLAGFTQKFATPGEYLKGKAELMKQYQR